MPYTPLTTFDPARIPDASDEVNFHADATYVWGLLSGHTIPELNANFAWMAGALVGDTATLIDGMNALTAMFETEATFDGSVNVGAPNVASSSAKGVEVNDYSDGGSVIVQAQASAGDTVPLFRLYAGTEQLVRMEKGGTAKFKGPVLLGAPNISSASARGVQINDGTTGGSVLIQAAASAADSTPMLRLFAGSSEVMRVEKVGLAYLSGSKIWTDETAGSVAGGGRGAMRLARNIGSNNYGDRAIMPGYELQAATADGETTGSPFTGSWRVNGRSKPGKVTLVIKE